MPTATQLCFAVFLASFPCTRAEGSTRKYNGNILDDDNGSGNHTTCSWNCTVIHSDLSEQRKTTFVKNRLIKLIVEYQKTVNEKCVKHTSRNSSGNTTEYFKVWLPANNKLSSFDNVLQSLLNWGFSPHTEERFKVKVVCNFRPLNRNLKASSGEAISTRNADFRSRFVRSLLVDNGVEVKETVVSLNDIHFTQETLWLQPGFFFFVFVFVRAFIYYSPAFICLFTPTVITENGRRQIVLEGASPVSLRSLVGNYFHARDDTVHTGYKARMLIFRLVVLPLPFLPLVVIFNYLQHQDEFLRSPFLYFSPALMIIWYVCYTIQVILDSTYKMANITKPCLFCWKVKPVNFTCNDPVLPRRLLNHLRLQPLILVKCWKWFVRCLVSYFKLAQFALYTKWFVRIPVFIVFMTIVPAVVIICLVTLLVVVSVAILLTSPIFILCTATFSKRSNRSFILYWLLKCLVQFFIAMSVISGAFYVLRFAALTVLILIISAFALLFSEENLPYVALIILVCYYLWSGYSSFKNKYHNLSLKLFKCYQKCRQDQISDEAAAMTTTNPIQAENTPSEGNVVKIPKELFDMACEELMPIREGVCKLVLKVFLILSFVFLAFFVIMGLEIDATPGMKALVTFFAGSFPKVVAICIDGGRQQNLEAIITEERAPMIVQDYINGTPRANQQDNSEVDTEEEIIDDDNEETIDIINI